nr:hypothetical protein [Erwinia rhapontici]
MTKSTVWFWRVRPSPAGKGGLVVQSFFVDYESGKLLQDGSNTSVTGTFFLKAGYFFFSAGSN